MLRKIRRNGDAPSTTHVAAFGKHPAWPDHLPDQGVETESLVDVKRQLYLDGIGGNITAGTWENGEPDHCIPEFRHVFCWMERGHWVLGRFWSSVDRKGRTRYPMVVCVESQGIPSRSFAVAAYECLERLERECRTAETEDAVVALLDAARAEMRARNAVPTETDAPAPLADPVPALAARPEMGHDHEGLLRLLYYVERDLEGYRPNKGTTFRMTGSANASRGGHVRVPRSAASPLDALQLWSGFVRDQFVHVNAWVLCPIEHDWVDLLIGPTTKSHFACIRSTPAAHHLITDVPYDLDDAFVARCQELMASGG